MKNIILTFTIYTQQFLNVLLCIYYYIIIVKITTTYYRYNITNQSAVRLLGALLNSLLYDMNCVSKYMSDSNKRNWHFLGGYPNSLSVRSKSKSDCKSCFYLLFYNVLTLFLRRVWTLVSAKIFCPIIWLKFHSIFIEIFLFVFVL